MAGRTLVDRSVGREADIVGGGEVRHGDRTDRSERDRAGDEAGRHEPAPELVRIGDGRELHADRVALGVVVETDLDHE